MSVNFIEILTKILGTSEASVRLIVSLFIPYFLSFIYKTFLPQQSVTVKNRFLVICGVIISVFNYGYHVCHSLGAVIFSYALLQVVKPSSTNVIINFVFHMSYLLAGYWVNANDKYDFTWTMPHCVLTLKLIGLSFDLWDGSKDPETLSKSFKKSALKRQPTFLEIMSFVFFPACYLVGPQFSMIKYLDYIEGKFDRAYDARAIKEGLKRCSLGLVYLLMYVIGTNYINEGLFLTDEYINGSFVKKHLALAVLTKVFLTKYIGSWLITEGSCITFGLAYNGKNEEGEPMWDGCRNVNLAIFERTMKFNHYVESFNLNTNAWVAQNVYKRMIFLNNPKISRLGTLLFLAVWHGVYSGYYMAFVMQFFMMVMEKDLEILLPKYFPKFLEFTERKHVYPFRFIFLKLYSTVFLGYCVIPFGLLRFDRWWAVYKSLHFSGFIVFMPYMFLYRPILVYIGKKLSDEKSTKKEKEM